MIPRLALGTCLWFLATSPSSAQLPRPIPGRQPVTQPAELHGTFEGVGRGGINVRDENNRLWQVLVPANARVHVTGAATADFLQSGLLVEFQAELDSHGVITKTVDELTLVSLTKDKQPGVFAAKAKAKKPPEERDGFGAEKGDNDAKPAKGARNKDAGPVAEGNYRIVGRLLVGRNGKFSVQTGQAAIALDLAEEPTVKVDCTDFSVVSKGDEISIKGLKSPARPGVLQANEITVKLAEPLSSPAARKKAAAKTEKKLTPTRSGKKDKEKDAGLPKTPANW